MSYITHLHIKHLTFHSVCDMSGLAWLGLCLAWLIGVHVCSEEHTAPGGAAPVRLCDGDCCAALVLPAPALV